MAKPCIDKPPSIHCISKTSHPTTTKQTKFKRAVTRLHFIDFQKKFQPHPLLYSNENPEIDKIAFFNFDQPPFKNYPPHPQTLPNQHTTDHWPSLSATNITKIPKGALQPHPRKIQIFPKTNQLCGFIPAARFFLSKSSLQNNKLQQTTPSVP
jgi:hypothetical protein